MLIAVICGGASVAAYFLGYTAGRADTFDEVSKVFFEALGKVVEMTNGLLKKLEELEP